MNNDAAFHHFVLQSDEALVAPRQKRQPVLPTPSCEHRVVQGLFPFLQVKDADRWLTVDEAVNRRQSSAPIRRHLLEIYDGQFTYECPTVCYALGRRLDGLVGPYYYFSSAPSDRKVALFLGRCCHPIGPLVDDSAYWVDAEGVEWWAVRDRYRVHTLD